MRALYICAFVLLAGCGGAETPFPSFVGIWQIQAGSAIQAACPAPVGNMTTPLNGNVHIAPSISADIVTVDPNGCDVTYKVSGPTATGVGGLTCTHPSNAGGVMSTETDMLTMITLTTNDGKAMTEAAAGSTTFVTGAGSLACTFTINATFTKVSNE